VTVAPPDSSLSVTPPTPDSSEPVLLVTTPSDPQSALLLRLLGPIFGNRWTVPNILGWGNRWIGSGW
jgi:hypothetical protein